MHRHLRGCLFYSSFFFFIRRNARQVQIRECFPQPLRERLDEGRGKENAFGDRDFICFSSKTKKAEDGLRCVLSEGNTLFRPRQYDCRALSSFRPLAYWDSSLRALPAFFFNSGSARESAGNNRKEGVHVAAAPAPFWAAGSASTRKERIRFR